MKSTQTKKITIEVTDDDIKNGIAKSCNQCPVALATKRAFEIDNLSIDVEYEHLEVFLESTNKHLVFPLPVLCVDFIESFDKADKDLKTFSFELEVPA